MAFVHPSRRALVPRPTPSTDRGRDRSRDRDRWDEDRDRGGDRDHRREEGRTRRGHRSPVDSGRDSPQYNDYLRRDSSPPSDRKSEPRSILPPGREPKRREATPENGHTYRQQENMYRRDGGFDGGGDYFERCAASFLQLTRETFSLYFRSDAGNSVSTALSASGRNPLTPLLGSCTYTIIYLRRFG